MLLYVMHYAGMNSSATMLHWSQDIDMWLSAEHNRISLTARKFWYLLYCKKGTSEFTDYMNWLNVEFSDEWKC